MALNDIRNRDVLRSISECDKMGLMTFLKKYGFKRARKYRLRYAGKAYPSKAILGVANRFARPAEGPLTWREFYGGKSQTVPILKRLGFRDIG